MYLEEKVNSVADGERERIDRAIGRPDASWYESYGRLKEAVDRVQERSKPLGKVMTAFWDGIARSNDDENVALLHQLARDASNLACDAVRVAALAVRAEASCIGEWELHAEESEDTPDGQTDVDETTGEVVEADRAE